MFGISNSHVIHSMKRVKPIWSQLRYFSSKKGGEKSFGCFVAFPDIPKDTQENNELLRLPINQPIKFSQITPEKCVKAIGKLGVEYEAFIENLEYDLENKKEISLDELIRLIEKHVVPFDFALTTINTLRRVSSQKYNFYDSDKFFARFHGLKGRRFLSKNLYYYMREFNSDRDKLNEQQKRLIDKYLLEARLSGTNLTTNDAERLGSFLNKLAVEKSKYRDKLNEATKRFRHTIDDPNLLRVLPDELIALIVSEGHAVTLESSVYDQFMEYCPNRLLRWNLWQANYSRASPTIDAKMSNAIHIEIIRDIRKQQAKLLGFENYMQMSLQTKMAHSGENVKSMLTTLHAKSKATYEKCLHELQSFAKESGNELGDHLDLWDLPYWQRKFIKAKYSIDDSMIKQYFPLDQVLSGMFNLAQQLFSIKIEEVDSKQFEAWHEDVRLFHIKSDKELLASFYFDPFARPSEKSHGVWLGYPLARCDSLQTKPLLYFIANLPRPLVKRQPVHLSFDEVIAMFKMFGHTLQHSLSQMSYFEISGLNNLEWDVINACSEFFSLWPLHSYKVIASCSSHATNKSQISQDEFNRIQDAHYHFASFKLKRELYKIALDLALYSSDEYWLQISERLWKEYMHPFKLEKNDAHPCSFREIFCDDYPAAYFSFQWAEMLGADLFSAFQEVDLDNEKAISIVGARFKDIFLAYGGGCKASEAFRRFRGRDPSPDAFLEINRLYKKLKKKDVVKDSALEKDSVAV